MIRALTLLGMGVVPGSAITIAIWQAFSVNSNGSLEVVISGGCLFITAGLIWKQSSFQTNVTNQLKSINEALAKLVSGEHMERRLTDERLISDRLYVTQKDCDQNHNRLNGRLNSFGKSAGQP